MPGVRNAPPEAPTRPVELLSRILRVEDDEDTRQMMVMRLLAGCTAVHLQTVDVSREEAKAAADHARVGPPAFRRIAGPSRGGGRKRCARQNDGPAACTS